MPTPRNNSAAELEATADGAEVVRHEEKITRLKRERPAADAYTQWWVYLVGPGGEVWLDELDHLPSPVELRGYGTGVFRCKPLRNGDPVDADCKTIRIGAPAGPGQPAPAAAASAQGITMRELMELQRMEREASDKRIELLLARLESRAPQDPNDTLKLAFEMAKGIAGAGGSGVSAQSQVDVFRNMMGTFKMGMELGAAQAAPDPDAAMWGGIEKVSEKVIDGVGRVLARKNGQALPPPERRAPAAPAASGPDAGIDAGAIARELGIPEDFASKLEGLTMEEVTAQLDKLRRRKGLQ